MIYKKMDILRRNQNLFSADPIYNNVKKLEKLGVLKGYVPLIDAELLGYKMIALIALRINQGKLLEVQNEISKFPQVTAIYDITGDWDSILVSYFKDRKDLDDFLKNQLSLPYVQRIMTYIVLNVVKDNRRTPVL